MPYPIVIATILCASSWAFRLAHHFVANDGRRAARAYIRRRAVRGGNVTASKSSRDAGTRPVRSLTRLTHLRQSSAVRLSPIHGKAARSGD